ncbi:MAG: hypothetical protein KatS3mg076_0340 [Candidatus Binatia bacterium]|nr:MAG: hypothetical protein KatS3mg076_0340 [Candidatus Binatia bacterium]
MSSFGRGIGSVLAALFGGGIFVATAWWLLRVPPTPPDYGPAPAFRLVERSGKEVSEEDLAGFFWVASFVFTRCRTVCPAITSSLARIQDDLFRLDRRFRLVSFSVDPEYDTPPVLSEYARRFRADPERWWFLTGDASQLEPVVFRGFHLAFERKEGEGDPNERITHTDRLVLVDDRSRIRGYYRATEPEDLERLLADARNLARPARLSLADVPAWNAALNATSFVFLLVGYAAIRRGRVSLHRTCMISAFALSCLFLVSYLSFHARVGSVRFPLSGGIRTVYLSVLLSHSFLAAFTPLLAVLTLAWALSGNFPRHRRWARFTLPVWLYVSLTGVLVYWLLYRVARAPLPPV